MKNTIHTLRVFRWDYVLLGVVLCATGLSLTKHKKVSHAPLLAVPSTAARAAEPAGPTKAFTGETQLGLPANYQGQSSAGLTLNGEPVAGFVGAPRPGIEVAVTMRQPLKAWHETLSVNPDSQVELKSVLLK